MHVMLFGQSGRLGKVLAQKLADLGGSRLTMIASSDIRPNPAALAAAAIREYTPDIVVNCTAHNGAESCDEQPADALAINGCLPAAMAAEAKKIGALLIHFSTDYVYGGALFTESIPETTPPSPINFYGYSKMIGEQAIQLINPCHLIFRLCSIYGDDLAGPLDAIRQVSRSKGSTETPIEVLQQYCSPTSVQLIADVVSEVISRLIPPTWRGVTGTYHLTAAGAVWKRDFAQLALKLFLDMDDIRVREGALRIPRPIFSVLSCAKFTGTFGIELPSVEEDLRRQAERFRSAHKT